MAPANNQRAAVIKEALAPHGARLDHLVNGSMVISFSGRESPTDEAAATARRALALRAVVGDAAMVACTGRGTIHGRAPIGEVIDRGVMLLQGSPVGSIRLDATTASLLDARFDIEESADGLYLRSERELEESARTVLGKSVRCVGRERELGLLEGIFADISAESQAHAVLLTASASVGKTRLRQELVTRLQQRGHKLEVLAGRADSLRSGSPFALLAPSIRWAAGISGEDSLESRCRKLQARVSRHLPDERGRRAAEFLGEMIGAPFPDAASAALRARARLVASRGPRTRRGTDPTGPRRSSAAIARDGRGMHVARPRQRAHQPWTARRSAERPRTSPRARGQAGQFLASWLASFAFSTLAYVSNDFAESEAHARRTMAKFVGAPAVRAAGLSALARAVLAQGRTDEALVLAREAMTFFEVDDRSKFCESLVRLMNAETLRATHDEEGALVAIRAARSRLLERAEEFTDRQLRAAFLTRIAENARTLELAEAWGCERHPP